MDLRKEECPKPTSTMVLSHKPIRTRHPICSRQKQSCCRCLVQLAIAAQGPDNDEPTDDLAANPHINESLRTKIYDVAGINVVITRSRAADIREAELQLDCLLEDEEWCAPELDPTQVQLAPLLMPDLWSKEESDGTRGIQRDMSDLWRPPTSQRERFPHAFWVPPLYRSDVLRAFHWCPTSAHPSAEKMYHTMRLEVWWRGIHTDVKEYVQKCSFC